MLMENGNIEKGREKDGGNGVRWASVVAAMAHIVTTVENVEEGIVRHMKKIKDLKPNFEKILMSLGLWPIPTFN